MPVITLSRQLGSLGDEIAFAVAERLKLRLVGREIINQAARQAGAPEVALAAIDELGLLGVKPSRAAQQQYRATVAQIIGDLVADGNIILVGRGSQVVLAGRPDVLHVRVIAPQALRIRYIQEHYHVSAEAATARITVTDRARADYLRRHYGLRLDTPELYDLILNTAHWRSADAADLICLAAQRITPSASEIRL